MPERPAGSPKELAPPRFPIRPRPRKAGLVVVPALLYLGSDGEPRVALLDQEVFRIGAGPRNDLVIPELEDDHALIEVSAKALLLKDCGTQAVRVNDEAVSECALQPGDRIHFGDVMVSLTLRALTESAREPLWRPVLTGGVGEDEVLDAGGLEILARIRALRSFSDRAATVDDYEAILELASVELIDIFSALTVIAVLVEEDGRNPIFSVKRYREGYTPPEAVADADTGTAGQIAAEAARGEIDEAIVDATLSAKAVKRFDLPSLGDGLGPREALAAPILHERRALGLIYFERPRAEQPIGPADEETLDLAARLLAHPISHLVV